MDASTYARSVHVTFEDEVGLLTLRFEGAVNRTDLQFARERSVEITDGRTVSGVILDARRSTPAYSPADLIEAVERTLDDIAPRRCAFICREARTEALMLLETVSFPCAVRVQAFFDPEKGRDWVLAAL